MDQSISARFWAKVDCAGAKQAHMPTCCWEWVGAKNKDGYGRFRVGRKHERAHAMLLWWSTKQRPGYVMHLCDNPCCVRPSHLQVGSHSLNMRDCYSKSRRPDCTPKGVNHYKSRFSESEVAAIRKRYANGETQSAIGASYNVHQSHISQIVRGKTYKTAGATEAKVGLSWDQAK
jgi:hypothetical protein